MPRNLQIKPDDQAGLQIEETSRRLPVELVVLVAEFLLGDGGFGSVANLNVTSRIIQEETRSALYETMEWDYEKFHQLGEMLSHGLKNIVERIAVWRHVKYLLMNEVPHYEPAIYLRDESKYNMLFPSVRLIVFRKSLQEPGPIAIYTGREAVRRTCSLYIPKPVYWSVVDIVMRSYAKVSEADMEHEDTLFPADASDETNSTLRSPAAVDNNWQIDVTREGQLIPDRMGPFDASKFSIVGCKDPSFLLVQLDDTASANLLVETLTGLLRLSSRHRSFSYGVVAIRSNCDLIPKCFSALASLVDSTNLRLALRDSTSGRDLTNHLEEWLDIYVAERQRCYRYTDAQTKKQLFAPPGIETDAWARPAPNGMIGMSPPLLEIISNPGANSSSLTITTTEIFPEANAEGRLEFTVKFSNIPEAGSEVAEHFRSKVYTYYTQSA